MQNILEEAKLTDTEPEPQGEMPEPAATTKQEATQPEPMALVPAPTEPDVIEGVFIEIEPPETPKDHIPPQQKPFWLLIPFTIFCCLIFLAGSFLLPLLRPSATVTLIPVERSITTTAAIKVQGRQLPPLTLMQSITALATGKRHQDAKKAHGTITFYNGLFSSQTIAAGAVFTASNGVQIVTDQPAIIPAGNPPIYGQTTVSAHTIVAGAQGNIQPFDINTACCLTSVLAKNTEAFTGGAAARDYIVVTKADIDQAAAPLTANLAKSEHTALQAQLQSSEQLLSPSCRQHIQTAHQPGDEAKQVSVTVSETCSAVAYDAHNVYTNATQLITTDAANRLGTGYRLIGTLQVHIIHATITDHTKGIATFTIQVDATYVYEITPRMKQHLVNLIAGKTKQQALEALLRVPGIQGALVSIKGNATTVPEDSNGITIVVEYRD